MLVSGSATPGNPDNFAFINLFRALAAFWVLVAHCNIWGGWFHPIVPDAKIAVDLFMMISGYLMIANADRRWSGEPLSNPRNWLRFLVRRYFRIAPAYYVSLGLAVALGPLFLGGYDVLFDRSTIGLGQNVNPERIVYSPLNILSHLTFLFGLHPTGSFSTFLPDWSLSLEMQFYAIFPLIMISFRRFGPIRTALALSAVSALATYWVDAVTTFLEPSLLVFKLRYFLVGMLLYEALRRDAAAPIKFVSITAGALLSLGTHADAQMLIAPALLLAMAFSGYREQRNGPNRLTGSQIVTFASDSSFGVYLFHGFFISAFGLLLSAMPELTAMSVPGQTVLMLIFVAPLSYIAGALSHRWIEIPGVALGRAVLASKRWKARFSASDDPRWSR